MLTFRRCFSISCQLLRNRKNFRKGFRDQSHGDIEKYKTMKVYNPGVSRRLKALEDEGIKLENIENIDDNESDFFHFDQSLDEYEKETVKHKELVALKTVGNKYFKEDVVNFLTWSEKELIRKLHSEDPQKWTFEAIAESFPTTPEGAKKLVNVYWKPASESRMDRHDANVLRNWKELQEGEMENVSPKLREHILKFSNRTIPPRNKYDGINSNVDISIKKEKHPGEYAKLVTKYEQSSNVEVYNVADKIKSVNILPEAKKRKNGTFTTLDDLREKVRENCEDNSVVNAANIILSSSEDALPTNISASETHKIDDYTNLNTQVQKSFGKIKPKLEQKYPDYPERIRVPKKSLKIGATYKVKDCYYDWDGRFLYRVPGME